MKIMKKMCKNLEKCKNLKCKYVIIMDYEL